LHPPVAGQVRITQRLAPGPGAGAATLATRGDQAVIPNEALLSFTLRSAIVTT